MTLHYLAQQVIYGLSVGATYALIALGYTMVYGVLRLINFAHGDVYMVGAVVGYYTAVSLAKTGASTWMTLTVVLAVAIAVCALLGFAIEFFAYRPLRGKRSHLHALGAILAALIAVLGADSWRQEVLFAAWISICCGIGIMLGLRMHLPRRPEWPRPWVIATVLSAALVFFRETTATMALSISLGLPAAGWVIDWLANRELTERPRLMLLITAIGVSLLLENLFQLSILFGPTPRHYPQQMSTALEAPAGILGLTRLDVLTLLVSLALVGVLTWVVLATRTGLALRAVSFRFDTATLMGINTDRIISFTFMFGSALAAVAGVLNAIRYQVDPLMGIMWGLKAFIAAVLGGIGSVTGALLGGLLLGIVETLLRGVLLPRQYTGYSDAAAFVILILILLLKPSGLVGRPSQEKV